MLFIPWIFLRQEKNKTPSNIIAQKVPADEITLISALLKSNVTLGVIGGEARESLRRMPTSVYWPGLGRWGTRQFSGSMEELHRFMDHYHKAQKSLVKDDDNEPVGRSVQENWHLGLPPMPDGFPDQANFKLSQAEASYLVDRIMHSCKNTLLAYLVSEGQKTKVNFVWEHPDYGRFPNNLKKQIEHARNFAISINGAALLYNLMLAEKRESEELVDKYQERLKAWHTQMDTIQFSNWNQNDFWELVEGAGRIHPMTRRFVSDWLELIRDGGNRGKIANSDEARALILYRERRLKRNRARLENQRALEMWTGSAGTGVLSYRWEIARSMINDILDGLQESS
jgi:hypothetical protein